MSEFDDEPLASEPADAPLAAEDDFYDADPVDAPPRRSRSRDDGRRPAPRQRRREDWDDDDDWDEDDDWDDRPGRGGGGGGRRDLTIVFAVIAAVLAIALVVVATKDDGGSTDGATGGGGSGGQEEGGFCGDWPAALGGAGKNVSTGAGVYIWSDFGGIHIRSNNTEAVTVKTVGNKEFTVTKPGDGVQASADKGSEITFQLPAGDGTSGPDLNVGCEVTSIGFEVQKGTAKVPPDAIKIGDSAVADANPAQFTRDAS